MVDYDLSGAITWDELYLLIFPEYYDDIKEELQIIENIRLKFKTILKQLKITKNKISYYMQNLFNKYDSNNTNTININELQLLFNDLNIIPNISLKSLNMLFLAINTNIHEQISYEEFCSLLLFPEEYDSSNLNMIKSSFESSKDEVGSGLGSSLGLGLGGLGLGLNSSDDLTSTSTLSKLGGIFINRKVTNEGIDLSILNSIITTNKTVSNSNLLSNLNLNSNNNSNNNSVRARTPSPNILRKRSSTSILQQLESQKTIDNELEIKQLRELKEKEKNEKNSFDDNISSNNSSTKESTLSKIGGIILKRLSTNDKIDLSSYNLNLNNNTNNLSTKSTNNNNNTDVNIDTSINNSYSNNISINNSNNISINNNNTAIKVPIKNIVEDEKHHNHTLRNMSPNIFSKRKPTTTTNTNATTTTNQK